VLYAGAVHALAHLGAVLVPLNTRLTAGELAWQLAAAGVSLLLYRRKRKRWRPRSGR
jgi:o-succinylbenzoate---CoA ligase